MFGYYTGFVVRDPAILAQLRERLAHKCLDRLPGDAGSDHGCGVGLAQAPDLQQLELGSVHECFSRAPAASLLSGVVQQSSLRGGRSVWVGRTCWAQPGWSDPHTSVFVDTGSSGDRVWAIDQALRCRGVACVIADGSGIDMAASRRLQLAAKAGGTLGLLVRPLEDLGELSAARTRWRVTPTPNRHARFFPEPRWIVELLRCKGLRPATEMRRWAVQFRHETGDVVVVPDAPDRSVETAQPLRFA